MGCKIDVKVKKVTILWNLFFYFSCFGAVLANQIEKHETAQTLNHLSQAHHALSLHNRETAEFYLFLACNDSGLQKQAHQAIGEVYCFFDKDYEKAESYFLSALNGYSLFYLWLMKFCSRMHATLRGNEKL